MANSTNGFKLTAVFTAGIVLGAFSAVQVARETTSERLVGGAVATAPGDPLPTSGPASSAPGEVPTLTPSVRPSGPASKLECAAGRNGGATAPGVTGTSIRLATTVVQSGIGAAFLGEVQYAMDAVRLAVNRAGGICGRQLEIRYVDDGWDAQRGLGYIRNFIKGGVFAIPVGPSSEGLQLAIKSGDIRNAGIPVVGTDGMVIDQYLDPWVWPVAVASASSARVMARDAYERGAKRFSIVFDKNYRFGAEAARAYNAEVRRLTGKNVEGFNNDNNCQKSFCGVLAGQSSYSTEVEQFEPGDFVAMFLEPTTALTWMAIPGAPRPNQVPKGIGAAQPLFTWDFGNSCQKACDQMVVWTSFKPPIERYTDDPGVRRFVNDLEATKADADTFNAFSEGGYAGMLLLVDALKRVGPNLTRERLREVLDSSRYDGGLTLQSSLAWTQKSHFANATMQAFTMQYKGTFSGWRTGQIVRDPTPERGIN